MIPPILRDVSNSEKPVTNFSDFFRQAMTDFSHNYTYNSNLRAKQKTYYS